MKVHRLFCAVVALVCSIGSIALAGEREEYLLCVTDALGRGVDLSEIGSLCLDDVRPSEARQPAQTQEAYPYEASLREVLIAQGSLFDPGSAQFKDLVASSSSRHARAWCGQLNSKNRLGGYVGWVYFVVRDRYRGSGTRSDFIDYQFGDKATVEGFCKKFGAWAHDNW